MSYSKEITRYEGEFQDALKQNDRQKMFYCIEKCCRYILGHITAGFPSRDDFDDLVLDAATNQANRLFNKLDEEPGYQVENLCNYLWLGVVYTLRNPKMAFNDKSVSYESLTENGWDKPSEEEDDEDVRKEKEAWTELLKQKALEALETGKATIEKTLYFDLDEVREMTVFDVKQTKKNYIITRRF
mgnify:CR=1 FL=1